ncbi:MAG: FG-GAP-like repeat-containing protein, partial [Pirellulales bacterium]
LVTMEQSDGRFDIHVGYNNGGGQFSFNEIVLGLNGEMVSNNPLEYSLPRITFGDLGPSFGAGTAHPEIVINNEFSEGIFGSFKAGQQFELREQGLWFEQNWHDIPKYDSINQPYGYLVSHVHIVNMGPDSFSDLVFDANIVPDPRQPHQFVTLVRYQTSSTEDGWTDVLPWNLHNPGIISSIKVGTTVDLNGDGIRELVDTDSNLYISSGHQTWNHGGTWLPHVINHQDLTGDGSYEAIAATGNLQEVTLTNYDFNSGNSSFELRGSVTVDANNLVYFADLNNDNRSDLLSIESNGQSTFYLANSNGQYEIYLASSLPVSHTVEPVIGYAETAYDFDNNGRIELLVPGATTLKRYQVLGNFLSHNKPTDIALATANINENASVGTQAGTFSTTDPNAGNTFTYSLVPGTGSENNNNFEIVGNTLKTKTTFTAAGSKSIRVRTSDQDGLSFEKVFAVTVSEANKQPTGIYLSGSSIAETASVGTTVGTFSTTDSNTGDTFTYSLVSGTGSTNNNNFKIVGNTLKTKTLFATAGSRSIRVRTTDQGGLTYDKVFTITLTESNRPPTNISLTNTSVNEKQASNSLVGNLSTADLDSATFTYSLVSGSGSTNNNNFTISGTQLRTNTVFSSPGLKYVRIRTTDQNGASFEKSFTITVNNINENPTGIGLSKSDVSDKAPTGTVVGSLSSTDPDSGNSFTYSLVHGTGSANNSDFQIAGNQLRTKTLFSSDGSKSIRIRTTDQGGRFYEKSFTILVAVNNLPNFDSIADISILEDASEQTLSLTGITAGFNESQPLRISATSSNTGLLADPDLTYSSPTTTGTLRFTPTSNQFGFTTITVTLEDAGIDGNFSTAFDNEMTTQSFDVTVTPVNDAPVLNDIAASTNEEESVDISLTG